MRRPTFPAAISAGVRLDALSTPFGSPDDVRPPDVHFEPPLRRRQREEQRVQYETELQEMICRATICSAQIVNPESVRPKGH